MDKDDIKIRTLFDLFNRRLALMIEDYDKTIDQQLAFLKRFNAEK